LRYFLQSLIWQLLWVELNPVPSLAMRVLATSLMDTLGHT
jgi:hypothetical protein